MRRSIRLRQKRADLADEARAILDRADDEGRDLTAGEAKEFDELEDRMETLLAEIGREERLEVIEAGLDESLGAPAAIGGGPAVITAGEPGPERRGWFRPEERLSDVIRSRERDDRLGVGALARAMVTGARNEAEERAMSKGSDSAGGYAVPDYYAVEVIDLLRSKTRVIEAGARTVPLAGDKTHFLRIESDPTAGWRLEAASVDTDDATFGRMTFEPKSLAVIVKTSRELLEDGQNVEEVIEHSLAQAFALELDRVALLGSGDDPEPRGLVNTDRVQILTLDDGSAGAEIESYSPIVRARGMMQAANAAEPTAAIMAPRTATALADLTAQDDQPLRRPVAIESLPFLETTTIPTDEDPNGAGSRIIVGDFSQLWVGIRSGFRLEVLREHFASTMEVAFLAHLRADIQVAQPEAFVDIPRIIAGEE